MVRGSGNEHVSPADRRAREVTLEYARKFKVLDRKYAADVVGDGDEAVGPFEAAQQQFFRGQVIPLCVGWFGEVGRDFDQVIEVLANKAACTDNGMSILPLRNLDRRGGARSMLRQQLRRALGVAIVRGNAKLKLSRLHYVRGTALEAAQVCEANHSERGWRPDGRGCPSWFASHVAEGYGAFAQFMYGRDYTMP